MKTIIRSQAIADLRRELLKFVDAESSLCLVAARRGLFCNGLGRWSQEELEERLAKILSVEPGRTRAEIEGLTNRFQLGLQDLREGRLPCDVEGGCRSLVCAGWDEFYESELAQFYREMRGEEVRVVPDDLSSRERAPALEVPLAGEPDESPGGTLMFASMDEGPDWLPPWVHELGAPAWVCDSHGNVTFLNERARQLFGNRTETCERTLCHRLVRGTCAAGEPICRPNCDVLECAQRGDALEPLALQVGGPGGRWVQILSIPLTPPDENARWLVHCACAVERAPRVEGHLARLAGRSSPASIEPRGRLLALSPREREVLAMLAADQDQKEIASELSLSYTTVHNHVQHILVKLGAHSIAEAVARYLLAEAASWGAVTVEKKPAESD